MLKKIILSVLIVIAGFAGYAAMQPSDFRITRSATIRASAEVLFDQVNNLKSGRPGRPGRASTRMPKPNFPALKQALAR